MPWRRSALSQCPKDRNCPSIVPGLLKLDAKCSTSWSSIASKEFLTPVAAFTASSSSGSSLSTNSGGDSEVVAIPLFGFGQQDVHWIREELRSPASVIRARFLEQSGSDSTRPEMARAVRPDESRAVQSCHFRRLSSKGGPGFSTHRVQSFSDPLPRFQTSGRLGHDGVFVSRARSTGHGLDQPSRRKQRPARGFRWPRRGRR